MAKRMLTEEQKKEIAILEANNEMLLQSIKEASEKRPESVKRIEEARADIVAQLKAYGIEAKNTLDIEETKEDIMDAIILEKDEEPLFDTSDMKVAQDMPMENFGNIEEDNADDEQENKPFNFGDIDDDVQYDIIPLPSHGQCYPSKTERLPVGYLTAYDENLITSPNLYKNGLIIDFLVKRKVLNKNFDVDKLVSGDVDAITLFLRATSYGPEFPIEVRDPSSGEKINSVVDLSEIKYREFTLEGDENGWFDFELPVSKSKVKFRYLTRRDEKMLEQLAKNEDSGSKALVIDETIKSIKSMLKTDTVLSKKEIEDCKSTLEHLKVWKDKLLDAKQLPFSKLITNRLELSIMSVNGNKDRKHIAKFVKNMAAKDALMLRRYINENEPGVDFEIEIQRPESLGGGSFKTFLEWGDTIFFNI